SVRAAGVTLTSPDPMPRSAEERSGIDDGERGGIVSAASMSAGEDFLGGAEPQASNVKRQASGVDGVDWSQLSAKAIQPRLRLDAGQMTWRKVAKRIRLEL